MNLLYTSLKIKFKECSLEFLLEIMSTNKHKFFNKKTIIDLHMKNSLPKKLALERHDGSGHLLYVKALQILHLLVESKYYLGLGCAETVSSAEMTLHHPGGKRSSDQRGYAKFPIRGK